MEKIQMPTVRLRCALAVATLNHHPLGCCRKREARAHAHTTHIAVMLPRCRHFQELACLVPGARHGRAGTPRAAPTQKPQSAGASRCCVCLARYSRAVEHSNGVRETRHNTHRTRARHAGAHRTRRAPTHRAETGLIIDSCPPPPPAAAPDPGSRCDNIQIHKSSDAAAPGPGQRAQRRYSRRMIAWGCGGPAPAMGPAGLRRPAGGADFGDLDHFRKRF